MKADVSLEQRYRDQEIAIARLMDECQALRDENADLLAQLEVARNPGVVEGYERLEATLRASPAAPATARAALTRWLSGHVPVEVLEDARLLASELITNSVRHPEFPRTPRCGSRFSSGTARCGSRCAIPGRPASSRRGSPIASTAAASACSSSTRSPRAGASTARAGRTCGSRSTRRARRTSVFETGGRAPRAPRRTSRAARGPRPTASAAPTAPRPTATASGRRGRSGSRRARAGGCSSGSAR